MKIKMELLSDAIFGNGVSVPGEEDISILTDRYGFPYYKGGTLKGIFREELERYLEWTDGDMTLISELLGKPGRGEENSGSLVFSDLKISEIVRDAVLKEVGATSSGIITDIMTNVRTFTKVEDGTVKDGSLRMARCINKGLFFYGEIICDEKDEVIIEDVLSLIKNIGTMRSRGFGKVRRIS